MLWVFLGFYCLGFTVSGSPHCDWNPKPRAQSEALKMSLRDQQRPWLLVPRKLSVVPFLCSSLWSLLVPLATGKRNCLSPCAALRISDPVMCCGDMGSSLTLLAVQPLYCSIHLPGVSHHSPGWEQIQGDTVITFLIFVCSVEDPAGALVGGSFCGF